MAEYRVERLEASVGELLARQDTGRDLRDLARYADDPVAFAVEVLHGQPWSTQRDIMTAVRDHPLTAVAGANGVGALRHLDGRAAILTAVSNAMSRLGGFHHERLFIGITEMSGVEAWALEALLGCAVGAEDRVVAVGNPFASADTFRRMFRPDSPWRTFHVSALAHPNISAAGEA